MKNKFKLRKQEYKFYLTPGKIPMYLVSRWINDTEDETLLAIFIHFHANQFKAKNFRQALKDNRRRPGWYLEKEVFCLIHSLTNHSLRDLVIKLGSSYDNAYNWVRNQEFICKMEKWRLTFTQFVIEYQEELYQGRELIKDIDAWSEGVKTELLKVLMASPPYYVIDGKSFRPVDGKGAPGQT